MSSNKVENFIDKTLLNPENLWSYSEMSVVSGLSIPDEIVGIREDLLRSDIHSLWARWFLEAVCDPQRYLTPSISYGDIFRDVIETTSKIFIRFPEDERGKLGVKIARLINKEVQRRRNRERNQPSLRTREFLVSISSPEPHCWICGYRFRKEIINIFLKTEDSKPPLPTFIDYIKPHGIKDRDLSIEVDHVLPVVEGGEDDENLQLACGWCNAAKGGRTFLYDVAAKPILASHPILGEITLPRPFWVIRTLAIRGRCEHSSCTKTAKDGQLTVMPIHPNGALNPTNLLVTCDEHDTLKPYRLVTKEVANRMWKKGANEE